MDNSDNQLRQRLDEITQAENEEQYLALIAAVVRDFPSTIVLLDSPHPIQRYTCVMHIFDFTEKAEYIAIASRGFNVVFAGPAFIQWLIEKVLLTEIAEGDAEDGDLVVYFDDKGRIKHVGLSRQGDRVESKWGKGGLFEHGLFEVPASYGTKVRFFRKMSFDDGFELFRSYAKQKGMLLR